MNRKIKKMSDAFESANATVTADSAATRWHEFEVEKFGNRTISITEKNLEQQVKELAEVFGWDGYYHTWTSIHSPRGFLDCVLARRRDKRLLFAELKSEKGKLSEAQQFWIDLLRACGQEVYVWRPSDFERIVEILKKDKEVQQ